MGSHRLKGTRRCPPSPTSTFARAALMPIYTPPSSVAPPSCIRERELVHRWESVHRWVVKGALLRPVRVERLQGGGFSHEVMKRRVYFLRRLPEEAPSLVNLHEAVLDPRAQGNLGLGMTI